MCFFSALERESVLLEKEESPAVPEMALLT